VADRGARGRPGGDQGAQGCMGGWWITAGSDPSKSFLSQRSRLLAHTLLHIRLADSTVGLLRLPLQSGGLLLAQVTALFADPRLVVGPLQVAPFHPGVFCIETHFRVLLALVAPAPLVSSVLSAWLVAPYCERQWVEWGETAGGTQVSLVLLSTTHSHHQPHLIYAGPPHSCSPRCIIQNPLSGDFRLLGRRDGPVLARRSGLWQIDT